MTGDIGYTVRRSDRARRVRITVRPDGDVVVTLPRRVPQREAASAVAQLRPWIERRLAEAAGVRDRIAARGATVPYLGETLALEAQEGRTRVHRSGEHLLVPAGDARPAIERWYRRMAREEIGPRLDAASAQLGVAYTALRIANQRTRWGSCSAKGAMSFNWRLLLAPPEVLDYVIWHEACHLRHLDHSREFWGLLERHRPGYRVQKAWLGEHGATLVL